MRRFAHLFRAIDETTRTNEKVDAMAEYFRDAPPADAAWAVWFLIGERPKRLVATRRLAEWAMREADVPEWLFDECYTVVGDLAETITLLVGHPERPSGHPERSEGSAPVDRPLHDWVENVLLPLAKLPEPRQRETVVSAWRALDSVECFVWNKLITGGWRVGVSKQLVMRALSRVSGVDEGAIAHRLSGHWSPSAQAYEALVGNDTRDADRSRPYPFCLAYPLEAELEDLGAPGEWQVEWKWDGIRSQLLRRDGDVWLWSRGEELVTGRFPEISQAAEFLPDGVVLDGEILPWKDGAPLPFAQLQRRIGRVKLGPKVLSEVPVVLVAYDLLEHEGRDVRNEPLSKRRALLEQVVSAARAAAIRTSPIVPAATWDAARAEQLRARETATEGLMLKRLDSVYGVGRRKGDWWKWKVAPHSVDAVMMYAQAGHGRRAALNTDYTFGVWDGESLVPFAKAYTGLTDSEIGRLDSWIRQNTLEKFGPVRRVQPVQVFEVAFEAVMASSRHKSGVAVRFPRILRWRSDKQPKDADTLETLKALAAGHPERSEGSAVE